MKGMNLKKMMGGLKKMMNGLTKKMNLENVVILVLLVVLVILVVHYVNKNNEGFDNNEKPKLYLFYVDWCPHCTKAKENVFNDKTWNTVNGNEKVELVMVNCEGSEEEKKLAKEFNVNAYPTVVMDNGKEKKELEEGVSPSSVSDLINNF